MSVTLIAAMEWAFIQIAIVATNLIASTMLRRDSVNQLAMLDVLVHLDQSVLLPIVSVLSEVLYSLDGDAFLNIPSAQLIIHVIDGHNAI